MTSQQPTEFQRTEFQAEYIRHVNQLSTGAVLLITIFLEKLFVQPKWKLLVGLALVSFLVSVIGGIITYSFAALDPEDKYSERIRAVVDISIVLMWVGFLVGLLSIATFALKNL